jgi:hypothetical protein
VKLIKRAASGHGTLVTLYVVDVRDTLARVVRAGLLTSTWRLTPLQFM